MLLCLPAISERQFFDRDGCQATEWSSVISGFLHARHGTAVMGGWGRRLKMLFCSPRDAATVLDPS